MCAGESSGHAVRPVDDEPYAGFNPGLQYCDILATDAYSGYPQSHHDELAALAQGKPMALGEVGTAPAPAILKQQPKWIWFMIWTDFFDNNNKREELLELFKDPHTLSRGDVCRPLGQIEWP